MSSASDREPASPVHEPGAGVGSDAGRDFESEGSPHVEGERGLPPHRPFRSVQSRVSSVLTVSLMTVLAAGLLIYYYSHAIGRGGKARDAALVQQQRRAQGESNLPPLSTFRPPHEATPQASGSKESPSSSLPPSALDNILGGAPTAPNAQEIPLATANAYSPAATGSGQPQKSPAQLALERRLAGPVLVHSREQSPLEGAGTMTATSAPLEFPGTATAPARSSPTGSQEDPSHSGPSLDYYLRATATPAAIARVLPTQQLLLPKGAFIDCTLETAISSSLPGMTTCITATDTFSADGSVVLIERGTKLIGETRGAVQAGSPRLFVLWTEARTPKGVIVPLESPGTDELGRSGLSGAIDWHWWQRFGSALLISVIDGAVQAATERSNTSNIQLNPSGASDVIANILRDSMEVRPTLSKPQGDRIEILVARDVDFRSVYNLQAPFTGSP